MGRILQLTAGYALSMKQLSAPLTEAERRALQVAYRRWKRPALPADDFESLLSPPRAGVAWTRRVGVSRVG